MAYAQNTLFVLVVSLSLSIVGVTAAFGAMAGLLSISQGILIALLVIGLLVTLDIHLRLEELLAEELP